MLPKEILEQFYKEKLGKENITPNPSKGHFDILRIEECAAPSMPPYRYTRKDFYKICLIRGNNRYHYADKTIVLEGPTLIFFNPQVPYTWEPLDEDVSGFFCLFTEAFIKNAKGFDLHSLPMFQIGGKPAYKLGKREEELVTGVFDRMMEEKNSDYALKDDLLRNYIVELSHFALKAENTEELFPHPDAKARLTSVFSSLLEQQFPADMRDNKFTLRYPKDFADQLSVHVNSLNRAVKETTGKTTTELISERIVSEAKILLKHSDMNISEIGFGLGFEEPSHFNIFFKKRTQTTPSAYRLQELGTSSVIAI